MTRRRGRLAAVGMIVGAGAFAASFARATTTPSAPIVTGETPHRFLHFTFDDGPDPRTTPRLLDALDRAGIKATFFFSTSRFAGRQARNAGASALAREVVRRGHAAGLHSFDHRRMARMSAADARAQIARSEREFQKALGTRTHLFRPPFGSRGPTVDRLLAEGGYTTVLWNIGLADWVERPPERVLTTFWRVLARNERASVRGGIVLMHDTHAWSVDAFEQIAASIATRNCELLGRGEEPYDVVDDLAPFIAPPDATELRERAERLRAGLAAHCPSR
jgi:peptidoglycan/xylan/chitin deacetylase (PgdA/CDA1 family)